ncbi:MAG: Mur ligase family protein [Microthrixaceae bacterium]
MRLDELAGARVVVLGLGIDNLAALGPVTGTGPRSLVAAVDDPDTVADSDRSRLAGLGIGLRSTDRAIDELEAGAASGGSAGPIVVLRAPGYPRRGPVGARLEEVGARFTTAVDLWMGTHGGDREVVGITGTKGKSTVTSLLDQLLDLLGIDHLVGGNIGLAIWAQAPDPAPGVPAVIEVSSYMAADAHHPPDIGVLTSLDADHLTWHGSIEAYRSDKLRLFTGGHRPAR